VVDGVPVIRVFMIWQQSAKPGIPFASNAAEGRCERLAARGRPGTRRTIPADGHLP